ncbi:MAG TPA: acyltransferase, partial [Flavisolibacter sp.]|nr:acyltransferase [Flavisolibacter sp.]
MLKIYFPGLNGLRAIAALIVIFFHINSMMVFYGTNSILYLKNRDEMSRHAVVLFFVLSGFLITYLLIKEKQKFGTIDIKKFYLRRILRIWPLFYAAILLGLLIVPFNKFGHTTDYNLQTIIRYALFIPNFALMAGYILPSVAPLWSVGVEEQFYAVWPVLLSKIKNILAFLVIFLTGYVFIKVVLLITGHVYSSFSSSFIYFSYDTMAIGGIAAWLYVHNHRLLRVLYHPLLQVACWLFFISSC